MSCDKIMEAIGQLSVSAERLQMLMERLAESAKPLQEALAKIAVTAQAAQEALVVQAEVPVPEEWRRFLRDLRDPEGLGYAVTKEVRDRAGTLLNAATESRTCASQ